MDYPRQAQPSLYAAFDLYPSAKGAATHIHHMAKTLFSHHNGGLLFVLGEEDMPGYQQEENSVEILRVHPREANFLKRTMQYGLRLRAVMEKLGPSLRTCHFRDPWSGIPILENRDRKTVCVYEINGLPSIELPHHYPAIGESTLAKIRALETFCWQHADHIITPSQTLKDNLAALGVDPGKTTVISNGADPCNDIPRPAQAPRRYLIYVGAAQPWQGLDTLIRAFRLLQDIEDLDLVICCSNKENRTKSLKKLAVKFQLEHRIHWQYRLKKQDLAPWLQHAVLSIAPLSQCSRNVDQGCCPLKIIESMAAGVAVVASDLPSVRELVEDGVTGFLVEPDRPSTLARRIRVLLEFPEKIKDISAQARRHFLANYTWETQNHRLSELYQSLRSP